MSRSLVAELTWRSRSLTIHSLPFPCGGRLKSPSVSRSVFRRVRPRMTVIFPYLQVASPRIQHIEPSHLPLKTSSGGGGHFDQASTQSWESNITQNDFSEQWSPLEYSPIAWLDAYDSSTIDRGTSLGAIGVPSDGDSIQFWGDKSGNNHHAKKKAGNPTYYSSGLNSLPTISLNSAPLVLDDSRGPFDSWDELHVFAVLYQTEFNHFSSIFGKSNITGWANNNSMDFSWFLNMHRADKSGHKIWGPAINTQTGGNSYLQTSNDAIWTHDGFTGGPSLITIRYSSSQEGTNFFFKINGQTEKSSTLSGSIKASPNLDFVIGGNSNGSGNWKGRISEFIIYDKVIEDSRLELYLQSKWLTSSEPLYDQELPTKVFEDQSGGGRPMFFYGNAQNNQNLFGSSLGIGWRLKLSERSICWIATRSDDRPGRCDPTQSPPRLVALRR